MADNQLDLSVVSTQLDQIHSDFSALTKALQPVVETLNKTAAEKEQMTAKELEMQKEARMFKRFVKMLKEMGISPVAKGDVASITTVKPKTGEDQVQEPIENKQVGPPEPPMRDREERDEDEEENSEKIAAKKALDEVVSNAKDEEEEEDKCNKAADPVATLQKENEALKKELETMKASIPTQVSKAVAEKLDKLNWRSVSSAPGKVVGAAPESPELLVKGKAPASRQELIDQLKKRSISENVDMHLMRLSGQLQIPEVQ